MELEERMTRLGGVAHTSQLETLGVTPAGVRHAVRAGTLIRLRRGWVHTLDAPRDVIRAVRVGGTLTSLSALEPLGVWCATDGLLHVRVGRHAGHLSSPDDRAEPLGEPSAHGVCLHRSRTGSCAPVVARDSLEEALMQMVDCQERNHAVAAFDSALKKRLTNRYRLGIHASRLTHEHREVLALSSASSHSGLETTARLRLRALGITYRTQVQVRGVGAVDLVVGDRLVIELDGREWHSTEAAFAEDRRRDFLLHEYGCSVLRFTYAQVIFEWPRVEALIRAIVARKEHRWSARQLRAGLGLPLE
ncbi:type IV toxin-antitoxin system AbiEi family antitoxin domain-containing protein [Subtercola boreus]|nr:type IV toxin-antitoxin system AbiEi family antitoxin domain-containing protein [Subtercola boreus]